MPIFTFLAFVRALRVSSGNEPPVSAELTGELKDLRKMSLNLLMAFLTIHAISPSDLLGTVTLALLVYTINLHIVIDGGFLRQNPTLSRLLHAVPLLGILGMTVFQLIVAVQSPLIAAAVLLACALTPFIIWIYLAGRYIEKILPFSVQMQGVDLP